MDAVGLLWRSRLRRRWRAWIAVALLLGFGAGAGLACLAGARRTASSFERISAAGQRSDLTTSHGLDPAEAVSIVSRFTGVAEHRTVVGFAGFVEGFDPTLIKYFVGAWDAPIRPLLRTGRHPRPDRADEVLVAGSGAKKGGIEPGDELTVQLFDLDGGGAVTRNLVVTGTAAEPLEVAADAGYDRSAIYFTKAFTRANAADLQAWSATGLRATPGTDVDAELVPQVLAQGWTADERFSSVSARVQDAIRPLTITLGLLGGLALLATLVVAGQALSRQADAGRDEGEAVRAMGFTPPQARALDVLSLVSVVVPGALVAVMVALGLSPLFPVGSARRLEPDRGLSADLTVLATGAVGVVVILVVLGRVGAHRSSRPARSIAPPRLTALSGVRPSVGAGVRLAVGSAGVERRRFWATVAFSSTAIALVVAGVAFVGALDRLSHEPVRYGVGWDLTARNAYGDVDPEALRGLVAGDADIDGVSGAGLTNVLIDGKVLVPAMPVLRVTAELWPTVVDGSTPRSDDEVLVGAIVLEDLGAEIGDTIRIKDPFGGAPGPPPSVTIVGTAVFPSVELAGLDPTRLGHGLAMTWGRYQTLLDTDGETDGRLPDFTFFDLADGVDPQAVIARYAEGLPQTSGFSPTEWLPSLAPAEVSETGRATGLMWTVIAFLGVTVVATIGHAVASTVRRRRGDYAVLKVLGFQRRQVRNAVAWQSTVTVALALLVGVPVGAALGRWAWRVFARLIGVIDTPVVPVPALLAVIAGTLVAGVLVAFGPAVRAGRVPAVVLREE